METHECVEKLKKKMSILETRVKHLTNELRVIKEEYEASTSNYFDLFSNMEKKVGERTRELQELQKKLEIKGQELQIMLDSSPGMIFYKDTEQRYVRVNKKFGELFGIQIDVAIGKTHYELFPKKSFEILDDDSEVIRKGKPILDRTVCIETADGQEKTILINKIPYKDAQGRVIGIIGFTQDLTQLKKAEEEKKALQKKIARAEKMEAIGALAGGVAHDLNNILAGIVSYPDLLLFQLPDDSPLRKPIATIQKTGEKAAAIVQDLLTLARRGVAATEVVCLNDIICEYLESPEYEKLKLYHPDVEVETNFETDLFNILASPVHLSKTIMNLVSNAAEAMPDGGKIFISTENRYVDRPIGDYDDVKKGEYVVLSVSDTGIGIAPKDKERIFEPFYTKKKMGKSGTGLGMSVVWGTVKDHNGYIDIQSIEGKGATFTLHFPVTRKKLNISETNVSIEDYMSNGESILVVDDVEEQRVMASDVFKTLGYSVHCVSNGEKAVEYMKHNSADLIVLDMIMEPGIDGLDTFKRIIKYHPRQKAIIVSGFSETNRVKEIQSLGAGQYIKKPYTTEQIAMAARTALDSNVLQNTPAS